MTAHIQSLGSSAPAVFSFGSFDVRTFDREGEVWFVASDVAAALDYRNAPDMTRSLDEDEKGTHIVRTPGGEQTLVIINESGMYSAILKSRKPEAKPFKRWVTHEVLPSLRKSGSYALPSTAANVAAPGVAMLDDVPVLTMQRLAACFGMSIDPIRRNRELFPERFVHGVHWFRLEGDALRRFGLANLHTGEVSRNFGRSMIVWTEAGAQMHAACFAPAQGKAGLAAVEAYLRGEAAPSAIAPVSAATAVQAPGASMPWPVSPADLARGGRVLLSMNHRGVLQAEPVPTEAFVATAAELAKQLAAPDVMWTRDDLHAIGAAAMARLARRG
ncbi:BRO family protein [Vogesella sp. AC12]|uniref:BRO family protein n=1 Tax=Vogesella sp. AC12 TaxID=2950550 RepID=UPI00210B2A6A|nr:BRO family protein [Vogesella sp. AC12]MCQ4143241.1 BRO family protein [Vogesella sp. AC12]